MKASILKDNSSMFWDFSKSLIFILGILLFFMGWIYLDSFLSHFGLSLSFIKIELTTFYFYGFYVLINFWSFIFFLIFFFIFISIYYAREKLARYFYLITILISIVFIGIMFIKAKSLGAQKAKNILYQKEALHPIRFNIPESQIISDSSQSINNIFNIYNKKFMKLNVEGNLYYLFENDEEIIVFYNPNKTSYIKKKLDKSIEIYKIRKDIFNYYYLSVDTSN